MLTSLHDCISEARVSGRTTWCRTTWSRLAAASLLVVLAGALSVPARAEDNTVEGSHWLRVCADPDNMPFSNDRGEGFENKLAELIATKLGARVVYAWFPESAGSMPTRPLRDACDLVMGYAQGTGLIEDTNPYYRTSYVLLYRQDDQSLAGVDSLADPRLKTKRIGIFARTPPASILATNGLGANAKPFEIAGQGSSKAAMDMIADLASGKVDAALLWGPVGGYYAQRSPVPLKLVPLTKETVGPPVVFGITMGVRPDEPEWKHKLNKLIAENQSDVDAILRQYNVPLLNDQGELVEATTPDR
jgi:quinoprotein dehydrogenase-associated probable ABC transporter substrate-binding protein